MKTCPSCGSEKTVKNGSTHNGKAKRKCKECGRQYTLNPQKHVVSEQTWALIERMRLEGVGVRAMSRITGVSKSWLQVKLNQWAIDVSEEIEPPPDLEEKKTS